MQNPIVIVLIVLALVVGVAVFVLLRRRRASSGEEVLPPPEIGDAIDYTSLPYEEPTTLLDRFKNAPPALKILAIAGPLVLIGAIVALVLIFMRPGTTVTTPTPDLPLPKIANVSADVAGTGKIIVRAETDLPDGAPVTPAMKENDQDFAWFVADTANAQANGGQIRMTIDRKPDAPQPKRDGVYTIELVALVNDQPIKSEPAKIAIPPVFEADFYQLPAPTPVPPKPTRTPQPKPTAVPPTPTPASEPTVTPVPVFTGTVLNGGNLRREPSLEGTTVGQISAGEIVNLLERSPDGAWYRVNAAETIGWVSATLLEVDPEIASQVPQTPAPAGLTGTVFNGGNVRSTPNLRGQVLDQINAGEAVQLLAKTADGNWYQITNIRNQTGWVSRTLLTVDIEIARQVPVGDGSTAPPPTPAPGVTPSPAADFVATVFNGGNVRSTPTLTGQVLDQINAGETAQLLAKTADGNWYQVTNIRKITGWVSRTLLTIDPDVARKVPVAR